MKKIYSLIIALLVSLAINAGEVTEQQALQKAQQFMKNKKFKQTNLHRATSTAGNAYYYVFNAENNGGFVIVAGDDRVKDILGYSERGNFDLTKAPSNVRWWLSQYEKAINDVGKGTLRVLSRRAETVKEEIAPFITTTWGQYSPYNDQCPEIKGEHCVTGCVATAMAQVMNYAKWPESATGEIAGYTTKTNQITIPKLEATTFNWSNMTNDDIARLMRYCGQSVKMDYGLDESGSYDANIPGALIGKFGYDKNMRIVYRNGYNSETWEEMIYNELKAGRPVIYGGQSGNGGHSFICHGYRDNMFYINWGWDGLYDGYFTLTALNPDGNSAYARDQTAIIGIQKSTGGDVVSKPKITVTKIALASGETVTRSSASDNFTGIQIECTLQNSFTEAQTVQSGFALYQGTELKSVLGYGNIEFSPGLVISPSSTFALGASVPDGTYRIVSVYRENESAEWVAVEGSTYRYVEAVIEGNVLTLKVMPDAAHDERLKFNRIYDDKAEVSASNYAIGGDIVIPAGIVIDGQECIVSRVAIGGFSDCVNITSVELPETIDTLGSDSFSGCIGLEKFYIPRNVMQTHNNPVRGCSNIREIIVQDGNNRYSSIDGVLYRISNKRIVAYPPAKEGETYTIGQKVQRVEASSFYGCKNLKKIVLPETVVRIEHDAFERCTKLEEINIPDGVTEIGYGAFRNCLSLQHIILPLSLSNDGLGSYVFSGCTNIKSITVKQTIPVYCYDSDFEQICYDNATLYVPKGCKSKYETSAGWMNFKHIEESDIPDAIYNDNPFENPEENQIIAGYTINDADPQSYYSFGGYESGLYKTAIKMSKAMLSPLVGNKLTCVRIALNDVNISNLKLWIGNSLDGNYSYSQDVGNIQVGWNVIKLNTPIDITGEEFFLGYEYTQEGACFPIATSWAYNKNEECVMEGSGYLYGPYGENGESFWDLLHPVRYINAAVCIQVLVEGKNLPQNDVRLIDFHDVWKYYTEGTISDYDGGWIYLRNIGKKTITQFKLGIQIDNDEPQYNSHFNNVESISPKMLVDMSFGIGKYLKSGKHVAKLYVAEINGDTPKYTLDDTLKIDFVVVKDTIPRQKHLIEMHTATWCSHSGGSLNEIVDRMVSTRKDYSLIRIHHDDELSCPASDSLSVLLDHVPGYTFNRVAKAGAALLTDFDGDIKNSVVEVNSRRFPAVANVNINAYYSTNDRIIIKVTGRRTSDFKLWADSINLSVFLTEDGLYSTQLSESGIIDNYRNDNVLRTNVSAVWGDPIEWNGDTYEKTYTIKLDKSWKRENMHVVAFLGSPYRMYNFDELQIVNCNDFDLKDAQFMDLGDIEISPIEKSLDISFCERMEGTTDFTNTVIDNTYYNLDAASGDGYDATEQALVLNSTTTTEQMTSIQNAEVGDAAVRENYNGIIFEVPAGKGTITVDAKTVGTHVLNVQIGNGAPTKITKTERGTADVEYNVSAPTYVYLYASTSDGSAARLDRAPSAAANSVLLYAYKVTFEAGVILGDANGDMKVNVSDIVEIVNDILGKPSAKYNRSAADVNGDGQVNVTDIVNVVNIIMTSGSK